MSAADNQLAEAAFANANPSPTGWWRATCPFCPIKLGKTDKRRSFSVLVGEWAWHCFRCGTSGKFKNAPSGSNGIKLPEATEEIQMVPPEGFMLLSEEPACDAMVTKDARKYLKQRGILQSTIREADVGITLDGQYSGRIVVPVLSPDSQWVGWVGRVYHSLPCMMKYIYPTGMKRDVLFNQAALYEDTDEPIFVVEGVFDALPHWPHAVACLGKPARKQIEILLETSRPIVVALDGDAWQEGEALAMRLQLEGKRAGFVRFQPLTDPGDIFVDELLELGEVALA